jgi:hypothetical protein
MIDTIHTVAATPGDALWAAKIQVYAVCMGLNNACSFQQSLGIIGAKLHQQGPTEDSQGSHLQLNLQHLVSSHSPKTDTGWNAAHMQTCLLHML